MSLQEVIDERIYFLKEQINYKNKSEVNSSFNFIDAFRCVDPIENLNSSHTKGGTTKNSKGVLESDRLFTELLAVEWLKRQVARYS
jgi:hypothetical protein